MPTNAQTTLVTPLPAALQEPWPALGGNDVSKAVRAKHIILERGSPSDKLSAAEPLRSAVHFFYFTRTCPIAIGFELSLPSKLRYPVAVSVVWVETTGEV